ncbi:MAG: hypothetical protein K1X72_21490 [Pyrinomonadaceae bacterium]|nr:hypothetical protein [Pyrinomonadaceae bacterium]
MNYHERNRYNMFIKVRQYGTDNIVDFPLGSVGSANFETINSVLLRLDELAAIQTGGYGEVRVSYVSKDTAREDLRESVSYISRTAKALEYEFAGISEQFRLPRGSNDQKLIATAKAFVTAIGTHQADFIRYGLATNFVDELTDHIAAFEATLNAPASARGTHVEATAEIGQLIKQGMNAVRILDTVVKNVYRNNVGKLAAWTTASNIETVTRNRETTEPANDGSKK